MCSNEACSKYREETGIMGGCGECGSALVAWKPAEPSNEQLENLMLVMGLPFVPGLADRDANARQALLNFHGIVARAAQGDEVAGRRLMLIKETFGGNR